MSEAEAMDEDSHLMEEHRSLSTEEREGECCEHAGSQNPNAEEGGSDGGENQDWWTEGSKYIGMRVARFAQESNGATSIAKGTVVGWLPVHVADFVSDTTGEPSALWHIKFDSELVGEEDLEEFEVMDAIEVYKNEKHIDPSKRMLQQDKNERLLPQDKEAPVLSSKKKGKEGNLKGTSKGSSVPGKPPNFHILWRTDNWDKLKAKCPPDTEFFRFSADMWKKESDEVKEKYKKIHAELIKKYDENMSRQGGSTGRDSPAASSGKKKKKPDDDGGGWRGKDGASEGGKSSKKKKTAEEPPFEPWFCITVDRAYAEERGFRLWEVCGNVKNNICRAREWYSFPEACPGGKSIPGEQRFKAIYTHTKSLTLDPMGWKAVAIEKGMFKGTEFVQIDGETQAVDAAYEILLEGKEPEPFPQPGATPSVKHIKSLPAPTPKSGSKRPPGRSKMVLESDGDDDAGDAGSESDSVASQENGIASQPRIGRASSSARASRTSTIQDAPDEEDRGMSLTPRGKGKEKERPKPPVPSKKGPPTAELAQGRVTGRGISQWDSNTVDLKGKKGAERRLAALKQAREALQGILAKDEACAPMILRLAWQDACSFDQDGGEWPMCKGCNGSVRLLPEADYKCNKDLALAFSLLQPVHEACEHVSWADLIQMAGALAVQACGGPTIAIKYGRVDTHESDKNAGDDVFYGMRRASAEDGGHAFTAHEHLRSSFSRMGFVDKEMVALLGGHALNRAKHNMSELRLKGTPYTSDGQGGSKGGQSWTAQWLKFDNSYYTALASDSDPHLLRMDVDDELLRDEAFSVWVNKYASDQELFFTEYIAAYKKMSELGAKFDPPEGINIGEVEVSVSERYRDSGFHMEVDTYTGGVELR